MNSASFDLYRLQPILLRKMICAKLAWSVKQLFDGWPGQHFAVIEASAARWLNRLLKSKTDGCDFGLHHQLVHELLADNFDKAAELVKFGGWREPRSFGACLNYGMPTYPEERRIYESIFSINDFKEGDLILSSPHPLKAEQCQSFLKQAYSLLRQSSTEAYAELAAFSPVWLLASAQEGSKRSFGGYSSSLAWGTIALNVEIQGRIPILLQVVHEMAHQLLFALAAETPMVFNHPGELFPSPLRDDQRPMDGVMHACFVSARTHDVLGHIQASSAWKNLEWADQQQIQKQRLSCIQAASNSLPIIDAGAQLSALGQRVVTAIRQIVQSA